MTRIVLIRHGEAQAYVDQVVACHEGCKGLSELGRRQAEALRDRLARTNELADANALYASVLPRAIETAEIVAPAIGDHGIRTDCDLCEVHAGEADGITWSEFDDRYGPFSWGTTEGRHRQYAPGSEAWVDFAARAGRRLWRLAREHPEETIVVACHGGVVMSSFLAFGNLPLWPPFDLYVENTSLTEWELADDGTRWKLVRYNDVGHLATLST